MCIMMLPSLEPKATKSFDHPSQLLLFEFQWKKGKVMSFITMPPSLEPEDTKSVDQVTHGRRRRKGKVNYSQDRHDYGSLITPCIVR